MAYIPSKYKVTNQQYEQINKNLQGVLSRVTWEILLMEDYVLYHEENDYSEGLSFLKRLVEKIGHFHPEWNLEEFQTRIQNSSNSSEQFITIVQSMLSDPEDVAYYFVM